jgi:hypothetical protein
MEAVSKSNLLEKSCTINGGGEAVTFARLHKWIYGGGRLKLSASINPFMEADTL